ncbi:WhiB family transcriptional regulator [Nocardia pseudobrasiliensis]|uniref:WhiB family redox-sensing transcriptional regulator n=1 Tax=Nocardia pseudobrasiliensis TaxID=45979 RepID=A0A370IAG0_9NOCA|nr:WhiB family transcriptional regulator [Nocardia pseudobrasiliensis]RDI67702.1 WhiB family redox-sensing transcriptional regulator [Nocardia pseudobrasiliensis]
MTNAVHELTLVDLLPLSDSQSWEQAACKGDPNHEAWFPYPSQDFTYARSICAECPIRRQCGEFAAATSQTGVWGGHEYDRGRLVRE